MTLALAALAALLYATCAWLVWRNDAASSMLERWLPAAPVGLHAGALWLQLLAAGTLVIGISEALSLFAWQSALLLWAFCLREPLRVLGLAIYPLAALAAIGAALWPSGMDDTPVADWKTRTHVVLSLLSAGVLTLAAVQAVALAVQERLLHRHQQSHLSRALPALQTLERTLFQLVAVGFCMLSFTLLSGLWFLHDWLTQHLAHKTVLSITAWLLFGTLLWGRWRFGWRGPTATRWVLAGYGTLILAYFGSKLILEQILGRHWT